MLRAALGRTPAASCAAHGARWPASGASSSDGQQLLAYLHVVQSMRENQQPIFMRVAAPSIRPPCATYGPFNPYIPIRSTTIGKSKVGIDPIVMHTSWRSNSDITSVTSIGYPRMSASGESSTTMHRLLHASGSHPIPPPNDPNCHQK
ncbi:nuclear pore complex protein Nup205-like [Dorcoceras hygrometricum]|uniref:Nuclear pore complex protein Nup205-like n=1 Tax=Dorcoceras hygrometricum TaxID=472368 RepID=A0A2Z7D8T3_9LAMI|nr:nuclear pore complex protein Nup205-like [Dorcoceras hygrometricum]